MDSFFPWLFLKRRGTRFNAKFIEALNTMKKSIALTLGFYSAMAQSMCYIVEDGTGNTVYVSERPPVNMAVDSPSKEVQAKYPGGHMLILTECPLTANQQEARRLQSISEVKIAAEIRKAQALAPVTVSAYSPSEKAQPVFYAGTLPRNNYGYGGYGYYSGGYYRPIGSYNHRGPRVGHYGRRTQ
jgi:hypothetical protein